MNTNAKHTPGPWRVECLPICPNDWAICGPDTASVGRTIGTIDARHPRARANARLIAAAPAMLEALRAVAALANGQGRANLMEISGQAQQIIAQAEGGAQ